jgi:predicted glycogen debranching enzyme
MHFGEEAWRTYERGCEREWLVTNGLGGFACGTLIGANTRRYHGLLTAALKPPTRRFLLVAKIDEHINSGGTFYNLGTNHTAGGVTDAGYTHLQRVVVDPFPEFTYACAQILVRKLVFMPHGRNAAVIMYRVFNGGPHARLTLVPLVNYRDYHGNTYKGQTEFSQQPVASGVMVPGREGLPPVILRSGAGKYLASEDWFYGMYYPVEAERGLNPWEDHFMPGRFEMEIPAGKETAFAVVVSAGEGPPLEAAGALLQQEKTRLRELQETAGAGDGMADLLVRAADGFLVKRAEAGTTSVIAGYPWFTDWGRDTMIALPGLTLVTRRYEKAREILTFFGAYVLEGLLPNLFPDDGGEPLYNTVDAGLWYIQAVYKYVTYTGDGAFFVETALPVVNTIVNHYVKGTRFGIRMDGDGLIEAGSPGLQLTWMDAKVGEHVVTPRHGKAVEINALWYNAVCAYEDLCQKFGLEFPFVGLREQIHRGFSAFRHPQGYLYDVLGKEGRDASVRPNQILAVSLPYSPLNREESLAVVNRVGAELYATYGLRSLSPRDHAYKGRYTGGVKDRDEAYHQGTVWSWLIGPFATAYRRAHGYSTASGERVRAMLLPFADHLADHGVGYVSEIFDGDKPHHPRGCFAQAWGVAEVLRAYVEEVIAGDNGAEKGMILK